jgi:hypothetical protein
MDFRKACSVIALALGGLPIASCLPPDDRPPPGSVTFTVSPSAAVRDGVTTADGWNVTFSRLMLGIGRTSLSDGCAEYAEARYDRLLDVTKGSNQKLSIIYGLGQCDVRFRIASPSADALLGTGVTDGDKLHMGTYGTDAYARSTASIWVEGRATREGGSEEFHWLFRKSYRYTECRAPGDAGSMLPIDLRGNQAQSRDIVIDGETLFRDQPEPDATLRFAPFADADAVYGNHDGVIDFDELERVPLPVAEHEATGDGGKRDASAISTEAMPDKTDASIDGSAPYTYSEGGAFTSADGATRTVETLSDFVYILLLPTLPRLDGTEQCVSSRGGDRFR